jgi:CubicO group peptidase (beta-lactamase class C family)
VSHIEALHEGVATLVANGTAPGAVGGVLHAGELTLAAAGTADLANGSPVTPATLFQIGSVTKVVTATIALRLAEAGLLSLTDPVAKHLPELRLLDRGTEDLTVLHLLTHQCGIEGDVYIDTGRDDDAIERLVERLAEVGSVHAPGAAWSYSNIGFVLLGRIAEKITRRPFREIVRTQITEPLGTRTPLVLADDVLGHHSAVGYRRRHGALEPSPLRELPVAMAPAGSRPYAAIADLLAFAAGHFDGATTLLSAESRRLMRTRWVDQPASIGGGQGLGWFILSDGEDPLLAHAGDTFGFGAMLVVAPAHQFAVALAGSTPDVIGAAPELAFEICAAATGLLPDLDVPPPVADADVSHLAGRYERFGVVCVVTAAGDGLLRIRTDYHGPRAGTPATDERVVMVGRWIFAAGGTSGLFGYEFPDGGNERMYAHGRLLTRTAA